MKKFHSVRRTMKKFHSVRRTTKKCHCLSGELEVSFSVRRTTKKSHCLSELLSKLCLPPFVHADRPVSQVVRRPPQ